MKTLGNFLEAYQGAQEKEKRAKQVEQGKVQPTKNTSNSAADKGASAVRKQQGLIGTREAPKSTGGAPKPEWGAGKNTGKLPKPPKKTPPQANSDVLAARERRKNASTPAPAANSDVEAARKRRKAREDHATPSLSASLCLSLFVAVVVFVVFVVAVAFVFLVVPVSFY